MKRRVFAAAAAIGVAVAVGSGYAIIRWRTSQDRGAVEAPVLKARPEGTSLILTFGSDSCSKVDRTDVMETSDTVRVAVYVRGSGETCSAMVGQDVTTRVQLQRPLGQRSVVTNSGSVVTIERG